jgi:RNA polymerase sigma-70 factor (ECF subfamily)
MMVERAQPAEAEARFNAIVEAYGKFLRHTIVQLCPKNLGIQFDDIEQDARLRLWRALQRESEIPALASYIYKVAVTTTIDAVRRVKARREEQLGLTTEEGMADAEIGAFALAPEPSPERVAERRQIVRRVEETLARFPEDRRRAVGLYLEGMTSQEIADLLGWSEPKARNLVYRGLNDLREQLRTAGVEYAID